jgi:hypothetical protein
MLSGSCGINQTLIDYLGNLGTSYAGYVCSQRIKYVFNEEGASRFPA